MPDNVTPKQFFEHIAGLDTAFLQSDELHRFVPVCCAMANGSGGWVLFGAAQKEDGAIEVEGVAAALLEVQLTGMCSLASGFQTIVLDDAGVRKEILADRREPGNWRLLPLRVGADAYRRVNGENVISGRDVRWRLSLDALELSRDDATVSGLDMSDLDEAGLASFREKITAAYPRARSQWSALSMENFMKRALVLDERGKVTRAGELLLGKNRNLIRLWKQNIPNLWAACETFLPRVTAGLTALCAEALRECFLNALLHADHDAGLIEAALHGSVATISNPGLPRSRTDGESQARNYRLMRIFVMAGLARGDGLGLGIIRKYAPDFKLSWDMLELVTAARLPLTYNDSPVFAPAASVPYTTPDTMPQAVPEPVNDEPPEQADGSESFASPGWLPVARKDFIPASLNFPGLYEEEAAEETENETGGDEYLGVAEDENGTYSQLVRQVRDTPRMPFEMVRDAILELCADYISLSDLSSTLARSEGSLRRHYITAMVKENLLEMEFPDRVGHPDQRYKIRRQ